MRAFLLEAPTNAPEMFKAVAGERYVVFSWSPHVTHLHGAIDNYTLSCSPSPSSLPQSPSSQSGSLTATGFSPNTLYFCSLTPNNLWGSGPPARANLSYTYFQLRLKGGLPCTEVIATLTEQKLDDVRAAVLEQLEASCAECASENINRQSFSCFEESPSFLTYRARLEGTSATDSGSLISLIEAWVRGGGASVIVTGVLMIVDSRCSVAISSPGEPECSRPTTTSPTPHITSNFRHFIYSELC
ncbi:hypothetical protein GBAR_LOCUS29676 [Geodia barretti]|uniref:Fibronectin type-III domain-containing protein n=1 Tax=Geodia barretti TaxID=519541 RepID=A0AA35XKH3_GEOBA|nr:hypothetical protein GBAR_LOCUS29676 [Geodia barretti]